MKTRNLLFTTAILGVVFALAVTSPANADCGKKSNWMFWKKTAKVQNGGMAEDMPMCCRMKMDHRTMHRDGESGDQPMDSIEGHEGQAEQGKKKEAKEVKDPVCSMTVDPKKAEKSVYKGKTYYFCSKEDKAAFDKAPEKYVKPEKSGKKP